MSKRDPSYQPPSSPDHPWFREALDLIQRGDAQESAQLLRYLGINDKWFYDRYILTAGRVLCDDPHSPRYGTPWLDHPWLFDRCREWQENPNGYVDLWPRFHWKTTLITQNGTLWDLTDDSNLTVGIFTYKVDGAGDTFLKQIKRECEINPLLHQLFPECFWKDPGKESDTWNLGAITLRRELNPREPTITVVSLVGSQPVSQHYDLMVYDDIVTRENVTPELVKKTNMALSQSSALGKASTRKRYIGTRWAVYDTWDHVIRNGIAEERRHDIYDEAGDTVLYSEEWIEGCDGCSKCNEYKVRDKGRRKEMDRITFSAQIRNSPIAEGDQVFDIGWIQWYDMPPERMKGKLNVYLFMDTARVTKRDSADYTAIAVVGVGAGNPRARFYLLDLIRDRLTLPETTELLFALNHKWKPVVNFVEQVGAMRDTEHFRYVMEEEGFSFTIEDFYEKIKKEERIRRLQHYFENGDWYFPKKGILQRTEGDYKDMVHVLRDEEMRDWTPMGTARHDDMLDVLSWVHSPGTKGMISVPQYTPKLDYRREVNQRVSGMRGRRSPWAI